MSAEASKPVATDAGVVEPTPAPAEVLTADKVEAPAVEAPKVEEPAPPAEAEAEAAAPAAAAPAEEKKEEEVEEPIHSGALGYKAPGLKNAFRFSKKYFWFGEEAVPVASLSHYLRGEKAEVAHPAAAWSSQTGKGLLYFVKHADEKATPAGVLNLSEATDLTKDGSVVFHFKLHGNKHAFEAQTTKERNGWFAAVEKAIEEAKAAKESIVSSEGYKEELAKIGKPAALAATAANAGSTPKKSIDATPKLGEAEAAAAPAAESSAAPARAGSSSSSSSDEEKNKKKKAKSKSRSVSRGKRTSIFGGFLGKKDKVEEKAEEKKEKAEEKLEDKKEGETAAAPAEASTAVSATAPVIPPVEGTTAAEETKAEDAAAPAATPVAEEKKAEEKKVEEKPKPAKRGSIFGNFVEKLKSPTHEKKEADILPPTPAKDTEAAAAAPATEETPAAPVVPSTETTIEAPKAEETKAAATTPHKEKQHFSFGKFLGSAKEKVRSPSGEKAPEAPKTEEPAKVEEATPAVAAEPAAAAGEPAAEAPKEETPAPETKSKRGSIFGSLLRNASKAGKPKKEKEAAAAPAKVEEAAEPKEEAAAEPAKVEEKKEETPAPPAVIEPVPAADVVPEAAPVGQAPKSTPQVPATA